MPVPEIDFSTIGNLGKTYSDARSERLLSDLGKGLADGSLDYKQAAGIAADAGKIDVTMSLLKLGEEQKASDDFNKYIRGLGGLVPGSQPSVAPMQPPQFAPQANPAPMRPAAANSDGIVAPPRAEVRPSARLWGDKEGEAAGIYERSAQTAQAPMSAPAQAQPPMTPTQVPTQPRPQPSAQPPIPIQAPNPATQAIPGLIAAMSNPRLPQQNQATAKVLLEHALKTSDMPPDQKNYVLYRAQGGTDDFTTWDRANKTANATLINTAPGLEAEQAKARIAIDTHAIQDLSKKAVAGRSAMPLLEQVFRLADKTPGGWAGQASPVLARAFSGLGLEVPEGLSNAELLNSVSRQFIPSVRDPGSTSNYEQQLYTTAVPGLAQSQEGRVKIARMFKAQIERNNEILQIYRQNIGSPDLDKKLAALDAKPMFAAEDRKALEQAAGVDTQSPATKLKPGRYQWDPQKGLVGQ